MATPSPLSMSQTKEDLVRHLSLPTETYTLMAKETDRVYKWLTRDPKHLKRNCRRAPPYDWSDILEKKKDEAMERIAQGGDANTSFYWSLAVPTSDCPNWIAKWFLYHKFRYRDGRNRSLLKDREADKYRHRLHQVPQNNLVGAGYPHDIVGNSPNRDFVTQNQYHYADTICSKNSTSATSYFACSPSHVQLTSEQENATRARPYDPIRDI